MNEGIVPCPGIDTDVKWGFSHTRGWIFGYKLHLVCNTDPSPIIVPLTATDVTTANIPDNKVYPDLTSTSTSNRSGLSSEIIKKVHFMVADPGYDDDHDLYESSIKKGFQLVCPVRRYRKTSKKKG